jgi:hypothetical protein
MKYDYIMKDRLNQVQFMAEGRKAPFLMEYGFEI